MNGLSPLVHIFLCFVTGGLWLPVYIICALAFHKTNSKKLYNAQKETNELLRKIYSSK